MVLLCGINIPVRLFENEARRKYLDIKEMHI
jgi:hypothetical protein